MGLSFLSGTANYLLNLNPVQGARAVQWYMCWDSFGAGFLYLPFVKVFKRFSTKWHWISMVILWFSEESLFITAKFKAIIRRGMVQNAGARAGLHLTGLPWQFHSCNEKTRCTSFTMRIFQLNLAKARSFSLSTHIVWTTSLVKLEVEFEQHRCGSCIQHIMWSSKLLIVFGHITIQNMPKL